MSAKRLPPNDPEEWLNRARGNLAIAQAHVVDAYLEGLCFQAQQAAEKAIKAVFIHRGEHFRWIHDLEQLLRELQSNGLKVPKTVLKSNLLSPYAVQGRYPGMLKPVNS